MTLTERLEKLHAQRGELMKRRSAKADERRSTEAVEKELVKVVCKILKFERKMEGVGK